MAAPPPGESATDDTVVAETTQTDSVPARIRPSRPSLSPSSPNYPQLTVVDPAHYVILREIARGGMGRIQVARDRRLGREVAVKEMLVQSGSIARRFEREARITARLQHPSIISVHEAGTWPSGEPFYAMRLVTGRSLDEVIAAAKTYAGRLALLPNVLAVADAMAYAHGERVIHRDLKPRNVVVGEFGETVVIDWGVAKDLSGPDLSESLDPGLSANLARAMEPSESSGGETTVGEVIGTPAYMPPEQAEGKPVDERADVYAIGAMLYHVLSGRPPFVADSNAELLAAVHEHPPPPLREVVPDVASDLVAIVERAMAREPGARYPSARALAEDLRRFQTGQLVGAHRYSLRQLLGRWIRRHRTAIAAIGIAALLAIGVAIFAVHRVVVAESVAQDERASALSHQKDAEELMQFMLVDLQHKLRSVGKLELLDVVARRAAAYYDARGDTGSDEDLYLASMARLGVGQVLEARGDLRGALAEYQKGKAGLDRVAARQPEKHAHDALQAGLYVAGAQQRQGDLSTALAAYRELEGRALPRLEASPTDVRALQDVFEIQSAIADILESRGELDAALAEVRGVLELANRRAQVGATSASQKELLNAHAKLGRLLADARHDLPGALAEYRLALALGEQQLAREPKNPHWLQDVAISHDEVGRILARQKQPAAALAEFRAGLALAERAMAIDPTDMDPVATRVSLGERVGIALFEQHDLAGALAEFKACEAIDNEAGARDPSNVEWDRSKSLMANKLGDVELASNDAPAALASYRKALAIRERLVAKDPTNSSWRRDLFYSHYKLASAYRKVPDRAQTISELRAAIAIAEETLAAHPTNEHYANDVSATQDELADELRAAGDRVSADDTERAAIDLCKRMAAGPHADPDWVKLIDKYTKKLAK